MATTTNTETPAPGDYVHETQYRHVTGEGLNCVWQHMATGLFVVARTRVLSVHEHLVCAKAERKRAVKRYRVGR